ncbi:FAD-dependent oxidoreductase [Oerskovia jenensis]|uniref:Cholesterol oxidase n=1 Tax=Oerskovia jenensis TaxID=162169 RepID=A0ABS2LAC5_9CELL|nr:GMC family oxidoreductase [Oerskovia jenensis]MBM7477370.1 cholesterol oxidase [Oerskovia jenensis]
MTHDDRPGDTPGHHGPAAPPRSVPPRTSPPRGAGARDVDVLVVGSGFGGSVAALRLTEKGYRVAVLEAGRRFADEDFAATSWHLRDFLWAPRLGCLGIQRVHRLRDVLVLAGAGVGGGSLVYANTLYEPLDAFYTDPAWGHLADWKTELAPYYDQARRMLGVVTYAGRTPADDAMSRVAREMGVADTFTPAPVGVLFGEPGVRVPDPFFGGAGPERRGCLECGQCMTGCRHGAKNTLVKNYLHLAERGGATIHPLTTVTRIAPLPGGGYEVTSRRTDRPLARHARWTATHVVLAAGAHGTQALLHAQFDAGTLPGLSPRLGMLTRTNSEALLGATADRPRPADAPVPDYTRGVAITSSFHPDAHTHVEPVRYGRGSNAMALLQTVLVTPRGARGLSGPGSERPDGGAHPVPSPSPRGWLRELWTQRRRLPAMLDLRGWSERTVIALVMQSHDNSLTTYTRRTWTGRRRMTSRQGHGAPNPGWIPAAHEAARRLARVMGGTPGGSLGEPFGMPLTAHFLGGCAIGSSPSTGVVDAYQRVFGHPGLHVLDGAAVSANLGVNPSLTITAQAERAVALWPNHGDRDPRPPLGSDYRRVDPVVPRAPLVPAHAPAALRLPVVRVTHGPTA